MDSIAKATHLITGNLLYAINATREIFVQTTWIYKDRKTGKLGGMLGDLCNGRAHMGGSVLFLVADRVHLIDYITAVVQTQGGFVFRSPPLSYTSNIYYLPFSLSVWLCSMSLVAVASITIYITYRLASREKETEPNYKEASDFFLIAISTVCQMDSQLCPKYMSGRISTVGQFQFCSYIFIPISICDY